MKLKTRITNLEQASSNDLLVAIYQSEMSDGEMVAVTVTHGSDEISFRRQPGELPEDLLTRAHDGAKQKWKADCVVLLPEDARLL